MFETPYVCLFGGTVVKAFLGSLVLSFYTSPVPVFFVLRWQAYGLHCYPVGMCCQWWWCQFPRTATTSKVIKYLKLIITIYFYFLWLCSPAWAMASSFTRFLDHTQWRATVSRTPLDEWSAHRRDLYLTTHTTNIHVSSRIQTHNRSRRAAIELRLRPHSHWDRQ
jgi:hypothetical protein